MKKYIDADKLIKKFEKTIDDIPASVDSGAGYVIDEVYKIIDSLQHEQPDGLHFIPLIRLIQKIPSKNWNNTVNNYAKKVRDCLIKEGYTKDAKVLQGYISYMNGNNVPMATMDEQEQPKVNLVEFVKAGYELGFNAGLNARKEK